MSLLPHVFNLLRKKSIRARVAFGEPIHAGKDRKRLSLDLHQQVVTMHQQLRSGKDVQAMITHPAPMV